MTQSPAGDDPAVDPEVRAAIAAYLDVLGIELYASAHPLRKMFGLAIRSLKHDLADSFASKLLAISPGLATKILKDYANGSPER